MEVKTQSIILLLFFINLNLVHARRGPHHPHSSTVVKRKISMNDNHVHEDLEHHKIKHKDVSDMSDDEKSFYYFKIHDSDGNDHLDGLEMLNAATHQHKIEIEQDNGIEEKETEFNHVIGVIDDFFRVADINNDGLINYPEYKNAIKNTEEETSNEE